jgi:dipeptidyl-peptidase-4
MNEAAVPVYPIEDWIPTHATLDQQRYPQPGDPNPAVRVGVVSAQGGAIVWVNLPVKAGDDYIPRFGWADAKTVWIETLTRDQKRLGFYLADAATGEAKQVLEIVDVKFVADQYDAYAGNGKLIIKHWGDGFKHLYLYSIDTDKKTPAVLDRQLTKGTFDVGDVYRVDFAAGVVDYVSNEGKTLEQQLWQVNFKGERKQLTTGAGVHTGKVAPSGEAFVDRSSSFAAAPSIKLCQAAGCQIFWKTDALAQYKIRRPIELEVKASDGSTLYATLLLPEGATAKASVPLITNPYGGPGTQSLVDRWGDGLAFDQLLTEHGFAVLHADNRGMGGRGREFEQACYHNFGPIQLEDQLAVIDAALAKYPQLDPKRLGWWGWSWGGTFTLNALSHSDRFRAGVAVASVTDWHNYDSVYTERYMSLPTEFPEGYKDLSVVNSAANLKGHLLLVHGTGDDNVHMANSVQYIQKLIEAGKPYDLQIYPRKTHSIAGPDVRTHLFNRIVAHFETYLKAAE